MQHVALDAVFSALHRHHVDLEYIILKPNMIAPGKASKEDINPDQVAHYTLMLLCAMSLLLYHQ